MAVPLGDLVRCWMAWGGIDARLAPDPAVLAVGISGRRRPLPSRSRAPVDRRLGGAAWLRPARRSPGLAHALQRPLS